MCSIKHLSSVAIAALFVSVSAQPADDSVVITQEGDKQIASFKIGTSKCVLKDDQIQCVRLQPAATFKHDAESERPAKSRTASRSVRQQTLFNGQQASTAASPLYAEADASH
jgi:hypothetical protein